MDSAKPNARKRSRVASHIGRIFPTRRLNRGLIAAVVLSGSLISSGVAFAGGAEGGPSAFGGGFINQSSMAGSTPVYMTPEEAARFEQDTVTFLKDLKLVIEIGFVGTGAVLGFMATGPVGAALAVVGNPMTELLVKDIVDLSIPKNWGSP